MSEREQIEEATAYLRRTTKPPHIVGEWESRIIIVLDALDAANDEIMKHQTGHTYEVSWEHGAQAGKAHLDAANARADEAEREVERLRTALESMADKKYAVDLRGIARTALTPEDTKS